MGVERRHRLVEKENRRVTSERSGQADALALAARQLRRAGAGEMGDPQALEELADPGLPAVGDVLLDGHVWKERVLLEDEADVAALGRQVDPPVRVEERSLADRDAAPVRTAETGDGPQHGRLAGTGGADERDRLGLDLER